MFDGNGEEAREISLTIKNTKILNLKYIFNVFLDLEWCNPQYALTFSFSMPLLSFLIPFLNFIAIIGNKVKGLMVHTVLDFQEDIISFNEYFCLDFCTWRVYMEIGEFKIF